MQYNNTNTMRYPSLFVVHGGGPMPLMGQQPEIVKHLKETVSQWLPKEKPKAIVLLSAHWESNPIKIACSPNPKMYYDYGGFPPETYEYSYPAPGNPALSTKIKELLTDNGIKCELDSKRGYDHGAFVPLLNMFPEADIPVVCVSIHSSLSPSKNIAIGRALEPLRDEGILILGSGSTFHNFEAFFNPSNKTLKTSQMFNDWLKDTILGDEDYLTKLEQWEKAPGARYAHPREEHLVPLFMAAAAGGPKSTPTLVFDQTSGKHAVSGYMFT